jgi:hypothetical protein
MAEAACCLLLISQLVTTSAPCQRYFHICPAPPS